MIDIRSEKLIKLGDVSLLPWLPKRRGGATLNPNTVHRWATSGCRGVKLEFVNCGDGRYTTEAAVLRFFERLAMGSGCAQQPTPSQKRKSQDRAKAILDAAGL